MRIQYIGLKDQKTDNVAGSGVVWNGPNDIQEVPDAFASKLLAHHGVWVKAGEAAPIATKTLASALKPAASTASTTDSTKSTTNPAPGASLQPGATIGATTDSKPASTTIDAVKDPLADLDDAGIRAYAKANGITGVQVRGINLLKGKKLHAAVTEALAKKQK